MKRDEPEVGVDIGRQGRTLAARELQGGHMADHGGVVGAKGRFGQEQLQTVRRTLAVKFFP